MPSVVQNIGISIPLATPNIERRNTLPGNNLKREIGESVNTRDPSGLQNFLLGIHNGEMVRVADGAVKSSHAEFCRENPPQKREASPEAENQPPEVLVVVDRLLFFSRLHAPIIHLESGSSTPKLKKFNSPKCLSHKDLRRADPASKCLALRAESAGSSRRKSLS